MNAKQKDKLMTAAVELLLAAGFKAVTGRRYEYYKPDSRGGEVGVTIRENGPSKWSKRRGWVIDFFGMYSDPGKAKAAGVRWCNPYSGKDNYLGMDDMQGIEYAVSQYR